MQWRSQYCAIKMYSLLCIVNKLVHYYYIGVVTIFKPINYSHCSPKTRSIVTHLNITLISITIISIPLSTNQIHPPKEMPMEKETYPNSTRLRGFCKIHYKMITNQLLIKKNPQKLVMMVLVKIIKVVRDKNLNTWAIPSLMLLVIMTRIKIRALNWIRGRMGNRLQKIICLKWKNVVKVNRIFWNKSRDLNEPDLLWKRSNLQVVRNLKMIKLKRKNVSKKRQKQKWKLRNLKINHNQKGKKVNKRNLRVIRLLSLLSLMNIVCIKNWEPMINLLYNRKHLLKIMLVNKLCNTCRMNQKLPCNIWTNKHLPNKFLSNQMGKILKKTIFKSKIK